MAPREPTPRARQHHEQLQEKMRKTNNNPGRPPLPNPCRRQHLDPNLHPRRSQILRYPPRQSEQDGMVGARRHLGTKDRRHQDPT